MKIKPNLFAKYGTEILPPPPDEVEEVEIPKSEKISPFLSKFVMEEGQDSLDPDLWRQFEPDVIHNLLEQRKVPAPPETDKGMPTVKIEHKKADYSPDQLLKMCSQFNDLCGKF